MNVITYRNAASFGVKLAFDLADKLYRERVIAHSWPKKFPIGIRKLMQLQEINKNIKIARRVCEAARIIWEDLRKEAATANFPPVEKSNVAWTWRELYMEIEQSAGSIFLTDHMDDEIAKQQVYLALSAKNLKNYIIEFDSDYKNFIDEIREKIRGKQKLSASTKLELICMLNENTQIAYKRLKRHARTASTSR